ncbi:DUF6058 family natural product biosynthesis protein [Devosia sp. LjRoot16]|uniref:DUF6058 family natural product biosynthesis protein n=1 Tax=Devosia sp. LjRoot16 TaxID=3342271 RepID=UPI003ECE248D
MSAVATLQSYVERHFVELAELADRAGADMATVAGLVAAGAAPEPSYRIWPNGAFSSPIGGAHGGEPQGLPTDWYAPAAVWWIRRALGMSLAPAEIAQRFAADFVVEFVTQLSALSDGQLAYPDVYVGGVLSRDAAAALAAAEWADWINGGYGVCLRHWSAADAIAKMLQRGRIIALTNGATRETLSPSDRLALLEALERLEAVILPFAPHQRPSGTPGLWIDRILKRYGLGRPTGDAPAEPATLRLCA